MKNTKLKLNQIFVLIILLAFGQGFAEESAQVCESEWWENCTSQPATQNISGKTYYSINSAEELAWFAAKVNTTEKGKANISSGINAILLKDIDLSGKMWTPIAAGKGDTKFSGILDGNEHKITGLTIDGLRLAYETKNVYCDSLNPSKPYCNGQNIGLIGSLGGTVKNLTLEVADIQASNSEGLSFQMGKPISVGTLVGWMGSGTIDGVYVNGHINTSGNGQGVGGLVGNAQSGTVKNSVCDVTIYASGDDVFVGGILGYTKGAVNVNSCMYVGESIANDGANGSVGGIVGKSTVNSLNATNSYYDTDVVSNGVGTGSVNNNKKPTGVTDLNTEQVACGMNGKTWDANLQVCSGEGSDEWEVGISELSQNGSDGYKITFVVNAEDASFPDDAVTTKLVAKNAPITADGISLPTREGYKFAGWAETDNAEKPSDNLGTATGRRTIYAVWYEKFEISFDAGSGSFPNDDPLPLIVAKGDLISLDIDVPVKSADGPQKYSFAGWSTSSEEIIFETDDEITGLWDFDNDRVSEAMTLYAAWTKAEVYTVKFNANGHGRTEWDQVNVSKDEYLATPPVTADPGYQYDGWYTELTFDNKFDFEKTLITKNYELFAKWSAIPYAINYNLDGGSVPDPGNPLTYTVEDQFVLKDPSRTCYDFVEWYDLDGNHVEGITKGTTGEKTFSARWKRQTKVINYSTGNIIQATATSQEFLCGESVALSDTIGAFSRPGYTQDGWTTTIGGNNVLAPKSSYTGTANVALYAHWSLNSYEINYELNDGDFPTSSTSTYTVNDAVTLDVPTRSNYDFGGWFDNDQFEGDAVTKIPLGSTGNKTFYAKWTPISFTVVYDLAGGTLPEGESNPETYTVETDAVKLVSPSKDNYTFDGWYTDEDVKVTEIGGGMTGNLSLTAKWNLNTYTVTYDAGEFGEGTIAAGTKTYDVDFELSSEKFTRIGYTQDGWENAKGDVVSSPYTENADITLYPHWVINTYTVTYDAGEFGEGTVAAGTKTHDVGFELSTEKFTRSGYTQDGWMTAEDGDAVEYAFGATYTDNAAITLYPHWVINTYTITYVLNEGSFAGEYPETYTIAGLASLPSPVKSGSKFLGWFNESEELVESIPSNSTGNITLTAQWAEYPILVATYGGVSIYENENGKTSALIDDEAMTPISIPENVTVDQVSFNRVFNVGKASTIVLPFSIDTAKVHGGVFYTVSLKKKDNGHWQAGGDTVRTAQLIANAPYIVIVKSEDGMLTFDGPVTFNTSVVNNSITDNGDGSSWSFKGTYVYHKWNAAEAADGNIYGFAARNASGAKAGEFVQFAAGAWLRPMRAYLEYTPSTEASPADPEFNPRPVMMSIDDFVLPESIDFILGEDAAEVFTTTLTKKNSNVGNAKASDRWFDMSGRKQNSKPTAKGIYYYNGKRVLVK